MTPDSDSRHDQQDSKRLSALAAAMERDPMSSDANSLITELIVGWRRYFEPWLVVKAGRQVADVVVSNTELRLIRLLRRKQSFGTPWRSVVWATVRYELSSERRRLAKRAEKEFPGADIPERAADVVDQLDSPDYDVARLRRARGKLSAADQEALELLFDRELSREQAAAQLAIPPGTLSVRKHRALERLRKAWDADQDQGV